VLINENAQASEAIVDKALGVTLDVGFFGAAVERW
jgi:hypothetical protein